MFLKTLVALVAVFWGSVVWSAEPVVPLEPFGVSDAVFQDQSEVREYRFIQSPVTAIGNQLSAQREWGLNGHLERLTYEIPKQHSVQEVLDHYVARVSAESGEILFRCQGRDCGRSNDWANQVFRRPGLYGQDRDQRYLAALIPEADGGALAVAVYVIRRGNQRIYAHLEWIPVSAGQLAERNQEASSILVAASLLGKQRQLETHLENWLPAVLKAPSTYRIYLVSYYRDPQLVIDENLKKATLQAESMKAWLATKGIPSDAIQVLTVGPLGETSAYAGQVGSLRLVRESK